MLLCEAGAAMRDSGAQVRVVSLSATTASGNVAQHHRLPVIRTRGVEAPGTADWDAVYADARKTPPKRVRGVSRNRLRTPEPLLLRLTSRSSAGKPLRKCH